MNQEALQSKKLAVKEIGEGLSGSESLVVVSYQGLTVAEFQELRKTLKDIDSKIVVYKNTLVHRALKDNNQPDLGEMLEGPNALVFSKQLSAGPKALVKFARFHDKLVVKGGLAEGRVLDAEGVKTISKLPDKNGLLSMLLSCLKAPMTKLAATLQAVSDKQGGATAAN